MKEKLKLLDIKIEAIIKRYRIRYYHEFVMSVVGFGLTCVYMLYVWARIPVFSIHLDTTMAYNITLAIRGQDLAGVFFALNPYFNLVSSLLLLGGCLWGALKLFSHSLGKISEIEYIPLIERVLEIEKEDEESGNE